MSLVELKDVVKRYGQHTVLNGVSLTVEKGEIIAIIGRSGLGQEHACCAASTGWSRSRAARWRSTARS